MDKKPFFDPATGSQLDAAPPGWFYEQKDGAWHRLPTPDQMKDFPVLQRMEIIEKLLDSYDVTEEQKQENLKAYNF